MCGLPKIPRCAIAFTVCAVGSAHFCAYGEIPDSLLRAVPKDAVFSYYFAAPDTQVPNAATTPSSLSMASYVIERAQDFGLLSKLNDQARVWVDVLASGSELLDYPHAGALLDISATPRPDGGHQLAGLHAALIIHTREGAPHLAKRIQHLLSSYSNEADSTLSIQVRDGATRYTLRDRRCPDWVELTWGEYGDDYIIAIGEGSFDRVTGTIADRSRSLADDAWFANAWKTADGGAASLAALLRLDVARNAADHELRAKIERVQDDLNLREVDRGLWTLGRRGRAVQAGALLHRDGNDQWHPITRLEGSHLAAGVIPPEATWYVILDVEPRALIDTLSTAYLTARSTESQEKSRWFWKAAEDRVSLSIDRDILALLRQPIISHDYPRHAMGLPFAWTRFIAVEDSKALRRNLDQVLTATQEELAKGGPTQPRRDADGVWYLYFGIAGPALTIADDWLIVSFSPDAVRRNVQKLAPHSISLQTETAPTRP